MARVRCITMQKDEGLLLDAWLRYYGYLFGFENVELLDNGSSDPLTLSIIERFEAAGVTVHRQHTTIQAFEGKGGIVAEIIKSWDQTHDYDFALPCDTDEFLALFTTDGMSCRRDQITSALDALIGEQQALWMEVSLFNVPLRPGWFHLEPFPKGFLPSRSILSLDSGFHIPQSRHLAGTRRTPFTHLHYHNKPYDILQAHTRRKLDRRVDLNNPEALRAYRGAGWHMTKNLLMSRDAYHHQFDESLTVRFEMFPTLMRALGAHDRSVVGDAHTASRGDRGETVSLRLPQTPATPPETIAFDGPGYLEDCPDVSAAGLSPLPHYLCYGFDEGRTLRGRSTVARAMTG